MGGYKKLIIIYLIFNTSYMLLDFVLTRDFSIRRLLIPSFALWYILSLIYWRFILQVIPISWINRPFLTMGVSVLAGLLAGFIPIGSEISFQRTLTFWPFFIGGFYLRKYEGINFVRNQNKWISAIILISLLMIAYAWLPPFYANNPYESSHYFSDLWLRAVQMVLAVAICFCVLAIIPEKMGKITIIGELTLLVYLLHPPLVKIFKVVSEKVGYNPDIFIAVLITILTGSLIFSIRKFKPLKYLT